MCSIFIAFILGIHLPFVSALLFLKHARTLPVLFPILAGFCLGAVFCLYKEDTATTLFFYTAIILLATFFTVWLSYLSTLILNKAFDMSRLVLLLTVVVTFVSSFFFEKQTFMYLWSGLLIYIACFQSFYLYKVQGTSTQKITPYNGLLLTLLLLNTSFMVWGNFKIDTELTVMSVVLTFYTIALLLGGWITFKAVFMQREKLAYNSRSQLLPLDPVTNLPSSAQAIASLQEYLDRFPDNRYAVITFKPINFPQVNNVLGHQNSDILLLQFAYRLQKSLEEHEHLMPFNMAQGAQCIARLQGLNFAVILNVSASKHSDLSVITELCELLKNSTPQAISFKSYSLNFDLNFGIAISGKHGENAQELIACAEDALLSGEEKRIKMNFFDTQQSLYNQTQLLKMAQLKSDITENKLNFFVQPQANLNTKQITGFELVTHWYNEPETPLLLDDYLVLAECSGEIYRLSKMMLEHAFIALYKLNSLGLTHKVSLKLSSKMLFETDIIDFIEQKLAQYKLQGEQLIIEFPEELLNEDDENTQKFIDQLESLSIGVSISHFLGSYKSLHYLRKLSVKQVKIDCGLLGKPDDKNTEKAIIHALVNLCRTMGINTIGANIQSTQTAQTYTAMGGSIVQGGVIAKAVSLNELPSWIRKWNELYPE